MGAREEFEAAEQKLMAEFGLDYKVSWVEVPSLGIKARILEVGEGEPLVFVHGGAAFAANWAPLMAPLKHRRLLAVDRPGFGLTPYVDHHRGLRRMAEAFLADVLDGLGLDRADFVVNSTGSGLSGSRLTSRRKLHRWHSWDRRPWLKARCRPFRCACFRCPV